MSLHIIHLVLAISPNSEQIWIYTNCHDQDHKKWVKQWVLTEVCLFLRALGCMHVEITCVLPCILHSMTCMSQASTGLPSITRLSAALTIAMLSCGRTMKRAKTGSLSLSSCESTGLPCP